MSRRRCPGIGAGCLLVFILAIGYYITPALVGGAERPDDQLLHRLLSPTRRSTGAWPSALGRVLLVATALLYALYKRLVGVEGLRFG